MKTYKWFFLMLVAAVSVACSGDSEDELIGNWVKADDFGGPRRAFASSFVIGNDGYVCAGYNGFKTCRRDLWKGVVNSNGVVAWTNTKDSLPVGLERQRAVGFSINGKGYIGTGWDNDEKIMNDFWEYDPSKSGTPNAWRQVAPFKAEARYDALSFVLNGVAYVGTGYTGGADKDCLMDFWKFIPPANDADLGDWVQVTSIGGSKRSGAVSFVLKGSDNKEYAYVVTGTNTGGSSTGSVYDFWRFDGTTWSKMRNITNSDSDNDYDDEYTSITRSNAVAFAMNGKGYVAIGSTQSTWEYEPPVYAENGELISGDLWTERTKFTSASTPSSRYGAVALLFPSGSATTKDLVFVGTGTAGSSYMFDMWNFYPEEEDNLND